MATTKKIPNRSSVSIFNAKDVYFFYEKILLVCESNKKKYGSEKNLRSIAKGINISTQFDFIYENYENEILNPKDNVFYFSADTAKQHSKRKYSEIVKKWYRHLRNSFAHNYVRIEQGAYIFEDYYKKDEKSPHVKTMYARVLSLDDFKKLVIEVEKTIK